MDNEQNVGTATKGALVVVDGGRAAQTCNLAKHFIEYLLTYEKLPPGMNRNVLKQTCDSLDRTVREIRRTADKHDRNYLDRNLDQSKLLDIGTVMDLMSRIGFEERESKYDEFMGLVVDTLDAIFYSNEKRRKLYFPKYKALFKILVNEIKADVNNEPGQIKFDQGTLYLRTAPPIHSPIIK